MSNNYTTFINNTGATHRFVDDTRTKLFRLVFSQSSVQCSVIMIITTMILMSIYKLKRQEDGYSFLVSWHTKH